MPSNESSRMVQCCDDMRWHIAPQGMAIQDYAAQTAAANVARVSQVFVHDDGAQRGALAAAMTAAGSGELHPGLLALPPGPPQNPKPYSPHPCSCCAANYSAARSAVLPPASHVWCKLNIDRWLRDLVLTTDSSF